MKKFGNDAFGLGTGTGSSIKKRSANKVSESIGFNLFGENQVQQVKNGSGSQVHVGGGDLGNPSSRQDAVILLKWYEMTLANIVYGRKSGEIK